MSPAPFLPPLTYCVCFSFLAVAVGWRGHLHSHWQRTGKQTRPHLFGAWVRWVWKGGTVALDEVPLPTGCRTARGIARTAPWNHCRRRTTFGCCAASSSAGQGVRWCGRTDWAGGSSNLGVGVGERWSVDARGAVQERGKRTRCETRAGGWGTPQLVLGASFPQLTSPGGGSHNLGRSDLCCLQR